MTDSNWGQLTDEQIERIAERAAEKAVAKLTDQVYREVGRGVVSKFMWIVGALAVGLFIWAKSQGYVK
ncbi:hypothetical protein [Hydrogenophaga sp. T2]|uniref:hypothetical protein n=1 Tax=Hydrogenophaga sp. T2 TaxID=3132823 RepID=UPI003CF692C2